MERTEAGEVLRAGFLQGNVVPNDANVLAVATEQKSIVAESHDHRVQERRAGSVSKLWESRFAVGNRARTSP